MASTKTSNSATAAGGSFMKSLTFIVSFALAAGGCTRITTIGWSGEQDGKVGAPTSAPRHATQVNAPRSELLQPALPALGDIDGDGFDDFMLSSWSLTETNSAASLLPPPSTAYLFYGRPAFSERLRVQDADATFVVGTPINTPLGDINGDGYRDFALGGPAGYELILGGPERLSGHHESLSTGQVRWTYEPKPIPDNPSFAAQISGITAIGDTNGDGYDDFAVRLTEPATSENDVSGAISYAAWSDYIILGRKDNWPTGAWDPSWAVATFGIDSGDTAQFANLNIIASGDLDGDGLSDLIAQGWDRQWLFYGRAGGFKGTLAPDNADAELRFKRKVDYPMVIGDLDGDGADDLATAWLNDMEIFYGSHQRYSGPVDLKADLTFYDQGSYNNPVVGDYNADGQPDLLFVGNHKTRHWEDWETVSEGDDFHLVVYQVKGTGKRLTGPVQLTSDQVYQPIGYPAPMVLDNSGGFAIHPGGDFDGDGSSDLVIGAPGQQDPADSYVLLLPGAARAPD